MSSPPFYQPESSTAQAISRPAFFALLFFGLIGVLLVGIGLRLTIRDLTPPNQMDATIGRQDCTVYAAVRSSSTDASTVTLAMVDTSGRRAQELVPIRASGVTLIKLAGRIESVSVSSAEKEQLAFRSFTWGPDCESKKSNSTDPPTEVVN